jgi:peptidoglycan hydrolase-like amidase
MRERADRAGQTFHVYDTTRSQAYPGAVLYDDAWRPVSNYEDARSSDAVRATAGVWLHDGTAPAFTQFSSSNGGWTSRGSQPYLPIQEDRWDASPSANPNREWRDSVSAASLQSRYPSLGTVQRISVTRRDGGGLWGGRVLSVTLQGSSGSVTIIGDSAIRSALGLRSSYFTIG